VIDTGVFLAASLAASSAKARVLPMRLLRVGGRAIITAIAGLVSWTTPPAARRDTDVVVEDPEPTVRSPGSDSAVERGRLGGSAASAKQTANRQKNLIIGYNISDVATFFNEVYSGVHTAALEGILEEESLVIQYLRDDLTQEAMQAQFTDHDKAIPSTNARTPRHVSKPDDPEKPSESTLLPRFTAGELGQVHSSLLSDFDGKKVTEAHKNLHRQANSSRKSCFEALQTSLAQPAAKMAKH
jgi:hypothetical protein